MLAFGKFFALLGPFGHAAGDRVLKATSQIILSHCRVQDVAFRFGGDEILILLPATTKRETYLFAKNLRQEMAKISIREGDEDIFQSDFSVGVIEYYTNFRDFHETFLKLDEALYQAKQREERVALAC